MKGWTTLIILLFIGFMSQAQSLPIDFETAITTSSFTDFDGGTASVISNPQSNGTNTSATVGQIVRNGGQVWAGSKIALASNLDFTSNNVISMKVFSTAPVGTVVKFKLEGNGASAERDMPTTVSNAWETISWDFTGVASDFNELVFMFDFGNLGDGSATSTFLFDDIVQLFGGNQIDMPVTFEGSNVNYTVTDFGGNVSSLVDDPTNASNKVIKSIKTDSAATWAGTTIGTSAGFLTDIPLTLTDSKMSVKVWSPDAGIPVRLKIENSSDPTQTCETEVNTTVVGWQTLVFDFATEAPGTAALSFGLMNGWTYNKASIFFNFGTEGQVAGEKTYYFDEVRFGTSVSTYSLLPELEGLDVFPNPTENQWSITSEYSEITSIEIIDINGRSMYTEKVQSRSITINAVDYPAGIYFAKVLSDTGASTLKLVKK